MMPSRAVAALALACLIARSPAEVRVVDAGPVAGVGGVLAVPIEVDGEPLPTKVRFEQMPEGGPVDAVVAWVAGGTHGVERSWTMSDERLDVREGEALPGDPATRSAGVLVALASMPAGFSGQVRIGSSIVSPRWMPLAEPEPDATRPAMPLSAASVVDQPDPRDPAEWFRWWLLADATQTRPPEPVGGPACRLLALHRAQLWQAGLERVERVSPGVARELRERLTAVCEDPRRPGGGIAAWVAAAEDLRAVLGIMLDSQARDESVMEAVLSWIRGLPPVTAWIEADDGIAIRVVALNPGHEEVILRLAWVEASGMPPLPLRVPPRGIGRQTIERPPSLMPDLATRQRVPQGGTLRMDWKGWTRRVPVPPAIAAPRPPGLPLGVLRPPLDLASAQRGRVPAPPEAFATTASVRRSGGAWEIFVECLRPAVSTVDALEILLGVESGPMGRVRVGEAGSPTVEGFAAGLEPVIERGSFADRWRCVVRMPAVWPDRAAAGWMLAGVSRFPSGAGSRQSGMLTVPEWAPAPVLRLDPGAWWSVEDAPPRAGR